MKKTSTDSHARRPSRAGAKRAVRAIVKQAVVAESAAAKRARALIALVARRKNRITEDFYDIGEALRELEKPKLYGALGYANFDALLDANKLLGRSQAYKLIAIVKAFDRDRALDLRLEKAFAIVTYAAATPAHEVPRYVADTAKIDGRPIAELSVREIAAATKQARARSHAGHASPEEKRAAKSAKAWQAALRKRGARGAVVVVRHEHGALWLDARVPADSAEGLVQALA